MIQISHKGYTAASKKNTHDVRLFCASLAGLQAGEHYQQDLDFFDIILTHVFEFVKSVSD